MLHMLPHKSLFAGPTLKSNLSVLTFAALSDITLTFAVLPVITLTFDVLSVITLTFAALSVTVF